MAYEVVPADLVRDRDRIVELWTRHLDVPSPDRWYEWAYQHNPCSSGLTWMLHCDDAVVGTAGSIPRRFKVGGRSVVAGRAGGLGVDHAHRFLGPALMLQKAMLAETRNGRLDMIYSSLPPNLLGITDRLGYERIGALARYVRVIRIGPYAQRVLGTGRFGRAVASVLDAAAASAADLQWRPGIVEELPAFDSRFDDLWQRASPHYGVTSERTSRLLTWRFLETPVAHRYRTLAVTHPSDGRLMGYVVLFEREGVACLADAFAEDAEDALGYVLLAAVRWAGQTGASSLSVKCLGQGRLDQALRRCGFYPRDDGLAMVVVASPGWHGASGRHGTRPLDWHFLGGDDFWE